MKTHVIHLASHDDYHSARDQMTWAKSARILLVLPGKEKILRTRLDLVLLERQAANLGAQLALVTEDEVVLGNAEDLKIPVFETIKEAQNKSWKVTGKKKWLQRQKSHKNPVGREDDPKRIGNWIDTENTWFRVIVFSIAVIAILGILIVLLPKAEIRIKPLTKQQSIQFSLRGDPNVQEANLSGLVPLKTAQFSVEAERSWQSSGSTLVGDIPASGELEVTNLTDLPLTVPEETVFITLTDPVRRYISTQPIKLQGKRGSSERVPIKAQLPGSIGNTDEGTIQGVEGPIGLKISVTNPESLVNGSDRKNAAPTAQDLKTLENLVSAALGNAANVTLQNTAGSGSVILPDSLGLVKISSRKQDPEIGVPADSITLKVGADYTGSYLDAADINKAAKLILDAKLPQGFEGHGDDLNIEISPMPDADGNWKVNVSRSISAKFEPGQIAQLAAGRSIADFKNLLRLRVPVDGDPQIILNPSFLGRFPFLAMRIHVDSLQ